MPGLVSTGIKRKHHALDEGGGSDAKECITGCNNASPPQSQDKCSSYTMQRKYVMNASICKLQATCNLIDPSLRRSVLIRNTLLYIDHELRTEGRHHDAFQLSTFIASTQSPCADTDDKDRLPGSDANGALNAPKDSNSNLYREFYPRETAKVFGAHPESNPLSRTSIHSCASSSSTPSLSTPSSSVMNFSSVHSNVTTNTLQLSSGSQSAATTTTTANSELTRLPLTNSEILDFGDELFSDIDMSLYDFDLSSPFASSHKASPVTPVSSSSEDWLRPVTGDFSFSADSNSTATASSQGNSCRSDIVCDELDQIMHVLVDVGM